MLSFKSIGANINSLLPLVKVPILSELVAGLQHDWSLLLESSIEPKYTQLYIQDTDRC